MDATFYVVRQPFYQLFTVNAFVRHNGCTKQLPLTMCVMSRRCKTDYVAVFRELCAMLTRRRIERIFRRLEQEATAALTLLLQYVGRTWIESNIWPPACWSVYFQSVRTNNDLEGWHTRLNAKYDPCPGAAGVRGKVAEAPEEGLRRLA